MKQRYFPVRDAFLKQRQMAKRRGIEFQFEFEQWMKWWEDNLGPDWLSMRGCRRGQYVMSRPGDVGPYHPDNVKCVLSTVNNLERNKRLGPEHMSRMRAAIGPRKSRYDKKSDR